MRYESLGGHLDQPTDWERVPSERRTDLGGGMTYHVQRIYSPNPSPHLPPIIGRRHGGYTTPPDSPHPREVEVIAIEPEGTRPDQFVLLRFSKRPKVLVQPYFPTESGDEAPAVTWENTLVAREADCIIVPPGHEVVVRILNSTPHYGRRYKVQPVLGDDGVLVAEIADIGEFTDEITHHITGLDQMVTQVRSGFFASVETTPSPVNVPVLVA